MFNSTAFLPAPPSLGVASCWSSLLALTPLSHRSLFTLLMFSANLFVFWIPATLQYIYLKKLAPWKINKDDPPDQLMKDCIKRTTVNTLVTNQVFMYWVLYPILTSYGMTMVAEELPSIKTAFVQLLVCTIINDVWFYWFHRALHHPKLYWIHKRHHLFHKSQIAFAAMYAHGIEGLLTGLIPVFMGPCFFGMHGATVVLFYAIRIWEGVQAHCGLQFWFSGYIGWPFPMLNNNEYHDFHHTHNSGNYGVEILDTLFGTDTKWREYQKKMKEKAQ